MDVYQKMMEKGIFLPPAPAKGGQYAQVKLFGDNKFAYVSGCGCHIGNDSEFIGKVGGNLTFEQGRQAAENCMRNLLATLHAHIGDLNNVKNFVKIIVFVSSDDSFTEQPQVANAASSLLIDIFDEEVGCAARSAVGVNVLPGDIAAEIEALIELK